MGEWWEWRQRWFVALSCDSLPGGDAPVSQFSSDSQTCGTCIISALVEDLGGTQSWDWHSSSHLYSLSPHSQQMLQEKSKLDFTGWELRLRLYFWGLQKGLVVSLAGPLWSPVACFGRGFARRQQGTSSWSTRASPALTNVSSSATPLLVAPPSHTLSRARRRTGSVSSSETAMASFPAAQIASGLIKLYNISSFIHLVFHSSGPIMPRITECLAARQEVAPEPEESGKPCSLGCTGLCLGPRCPGQILDNRN